MKKFGVFSGNMVEALTRMDNSITGLELLASFYKSKGKDNIKPAFYEVECEKIEDAKKIVQENNNNEYLAIKNFINDLEFFEIGEKIDLNNINITEYIGATIIGGANFAKNNPVLSELIKRTELLKKHSKDSVEKIIS